MNQKGNMTDGKEWKQLLLFALPLMAGNALQQLYNTVDGIIVGNYVGDTALAAVGACAPMTMLFVMLAIGMSAGSSVVIAQYYGAGKVGEMRRTVSTSIILLLIMGVVLSVVGVLVARPFLEHVLSVSDPYLDYAADYFSIYAMGLVFQFAYNIFAAILRALGDSKATLYFLLISSVVNLGLDLLFVVGFPWEVAGAAIATVISQAVSAVAAVIYMMRKHEVLRFQKGEFRFHSASAKLSLRIAIPNTLQQTIVSCGNLALQRIINDFGAVYTGLMSGATAGMRLESFILIPIFSFNTALSTFTGQNIGAGKIQRVEKGRKVDLLMSLAVSAVMAVVVFLLRSPLVSLFGVSEDGLKYGMLYLTVLCPGLIIFCVQIINSGVLQGSGDIKYLAFVTLSSFALRCVFAYPLAYCTSLGYLAVWLSQPLGWLYGLVLNTLRYRSGKWKQKGVAHVKT